MDPNELKPNEIVGVNKDSYLLFEKLPPEYDSRGNNIIHKLKIYLMMCQKILFAISLKSFNKIFELKIIKKIA